MQTKAIVGNDFVDAEGVRNFCFQICRHQNGRLESIAVLRVECGQAGVPSFQFVAIKAYVRKQLAIQRLAAVYMRRSVPMRFTNRLAEAKP